MKPHSFPVRVISSFPSPLVGEGQGGGDVSIDEGRNIGKDIYVARGRILRSNMTDAEQKLWYWLRKKTPGVRFRRQAPIGRYIADFACYDPKLIIELDGGQHATQKTYDEKRDFWLKAQGFHILRFWNNEVMENNDGVLRVITDTLNMLKLPPHPNLPPQGRKEQL